MRSPDRVNVLAGLAVLMIFSLACSVFGSQSNEPGNEGPMVQENPPHPGPVEPMQPQGQEPAPPMPPQGGEPPQPGEPQPPQGQEPQPPAQVRHEDVPASTSVDESTIHDQQTKATAAEKYAYGGDTYTDNRLERPFNREMNYLPWLDIIDANLARDEPFMYFSLVVQERSFSGEGDPPVYGIEIDVDLDGRGDLLVQTILPREGEWGQQGVAVFEDSNENVGGETPVESDEGRGGGDGYERLFFEAGHGDDPDLAWSRLDPDDDTRIDIAFHSSFFKENQVFLWSGFTDGFPAGPEAFDHNDRFSLQEAGSAMKSSEYYPLKAFFAFDNTCRTTSGFDPKGTEPGICPNIVPTSPDNVKQCQVTCFGQNECFCLY